MTRAAIENVRTLIKENNLLNLRWYEGAAKAKFANIEAALDHFVSTGMQSEIAPNALFSPSYYRYSYQGIIPKGMPTFEHYLLHGIAEEYSPHPIVDPGWVSEQLDELGLKEPVMNVLLHKCSALGIDPHPCFSVRFYLDRNPELAARRMHPVIHFLEHGIKERRSPHPLIWMKWMCANNELASVDQDPFFSYLLDGKFDHLYPNPFFDGQAYAETYADVKKSGLNPLYHYLRFGKSEQRAPNPGFDIAWFANKFALQLKTTRLDPLSFLLMYGGNRLHADSDGAMLKIANEKFLHSLDSSLREQFQGRVPAQGRSKRILYVSHNLRFQGAQNSLFELSTGMKRFEARDVSVIAPDDGPMLAAYGAAGVPVHKYRLPVAGLADIKDYEKLWNRFKEQIKALRPDIIHGNTIQSYHAIAAGAELGIPTVWNVRESEDPGTHFAGLTPIAQEKLQQAIERHTRMVFVSATTKDVWLNAYPEVRTATINNGIDYTRLVSAAGGVGRAVVRNALGIKDDDVVFINVGTWTERKGQIDIVKALKSLDRRLWNKVRIILIGANESDYAKKLKSEIAELPGVLFDRVIALEETKSGFERSKVIGCLMAADVFIMSSRIESYPRVVNEALYFGLPVIATPCFGVIEQVVDGRESSFYSAGNSEQLARKMESLCQSRRSLSRMAQEARISAMSRVKQYDEMLREYGGIYDQLVQ